MADRRRARVLAAVAAASVAAGVLTGGCAAIPSSGVVQSTPTPPALGAGGGDCCGLIVSGPRPGWSPERVVSNFLLASAIFAHDHAIARRYLTPAANKAWRPLSAVTILAKPPKVFQQSGRLSGAEGRATVIVNGQRLATLQHDQYIPAAPGDAFPLAFTLQATNGRYLIDGLPPTGPGKVSHALLLTSYLFHLVYTPRNLYFYALQGGALVPDPVFVPTGASGSVTTLINDLIHRPGGSLAGAARTAFPRGAQLRKFQALPGPPGGKTALVDIRLPPGVSRQQVAAMARQLVCTLTSGAYSTPLFRAVKLRVNGHVSDPARPVHDLADYVQDIPHWRNNAVVYYPVQNGSVKKLGRLSARSQAVPGQAGTSQVPLGSIAVSLNGRYLAGIAGPATTLYTSDLGAAAKPNASPSAGRLRRQLTGRSLSGLSWDREGNLWVTGTVHGSDGVWVLPGGRAPVRVYLPSRLGPVTGLRVAPDGVRVALIVGKGAGAHVVLAVAVRDGGVFSLVHPVPLGPNLSGVTALTWYDEDHLLAVAGTSAGTSLSEVPADGDSATGKGGQSGIVSITAAGTQNPLYLSLSTGQLEKSVGLGEPWTVIAEGRAAAYPG